MGTTLHARPVAAHRGATRALLLAGVLAGPLYLLVSLVEILSRDGFDPLRHSWSLLSNGEWGWIHIANLVVAGTLTIAGAVGLRRALSSGRGARAAPILLGIYGAGLVAAGVFVADPAAGFPPGTPEGAPSTVTWHGMLHFVSGGVAFLCLIAACIVLSRRFAKEGARGWATYSLLVGVAFLGSFVGIASGSSSPAIVLAFTAGVVLSSTWISAVCAYFRRTVE